MSNAILIDMNLSVEWVPFLNQAGWPATHWSSVGAADAKDEELMAWAVAQKHIVFTHDLDFSAALAITRATQPSVIQIRTQRVLPEHIGTLVVTALKRYDADLASGALVVVEEARSRARILPL